MDERIDILEREVSAIKSEIAVLKSTCWTRDDARAFDARLGRIEAEIGVVHADVSVLKADLAALKAVVAQLQIDVAQIKIQLTHLATKAELRELKTQLTTWMIATALTIIGVMSGTQFALYSALKH